MAAGFSRRFGTADKRHAIMADGRTLLATTLAQLRSPVSTASYQVAVVIRPEDDATVLGIPADLPILHAPSAAQGLGASIADAVRAVLANPELLDVDSLAIMLGDMPGIQTDTFTNLINAGGRSQIVRPRYQGIPGHPVLFGRDFWMSLIHLNGDEGARSVIRENPDSLLYIELDDSGVIADIDTPEQLLQP